MEIYYEGTDITNLVQVKKCVGREMSGGRCDSLEMEFENAAGWYRWGPQEDDKILVKMGGMDTGIMYLNTVLPEDGRYRIFATSLPCKARAKAWRSFTGKTIEDIMRACAMASGMDFQIFGIEKNIVIPYVQQENEGCAAFLDRLLFWEGAKLKCVNGKFTAIGIPWAQEQKAGQTIGVSARQRGTQYMRNGRKYRALIVSAPGGNAKAEDMAVDSSHMILTVTGLPARNDIQAGRWARGILLQKNRECETLTVQNKFNAGFAAMIRINVSGETDAAGEWLIEEVENDYKNQTSKAVMHRCITTIQ